MDYYFLLTLAIILLSTKVLGLASRRVHMPAVVGALLAGIILGPVGFGILQTDDFITQTAQLGVIMMMFLAGLDTDLQELKETGVMSFIIAICGVLIPVAGGFAVYTGFFSLSDTQSFLEATFLGVVLMATSVSITVETLRELGKLRGKVGTAILGAAIIDDIIGIVVLSFVTSFVDESVNPMWVIVKMVGFFIFIVVVGWLVHIIFRREDKYHHDTRRVAIYGLALCLILSFIAEEVFGVADITGAFFAGIMLCTLGAREYVAKKINIASYLIFSPIFFASIGMQIDFSGMTSNLIWFTIALVAVAIVTKILGGYIGSRICKFTKRESLSIGLGLVSRGEVVLVIAQKGFAVGLLSTVLFPSIIAVVVVTALVTPILIKWSFAHEDKPAV